MMLKYTEDSLKTNVEECGKKRILPGVSETSLGQSEAKNVLSGQVFHRNSIFRRNKQVPEWCYYETPQPPCLCKQHHHLLYL